MLKSAYASTDIGKDITGKDVKVYFTKQILDGKEVIVMDMPSLYVTVRFDENTILSMWKFLKEGNPKNNKSTGFQEPTTKNFDADDRILRAMKGGKYYE